MCSGTDGCIRQDLLARCQRSKRRVIKPIANFCTLIAESSAENTQNVIDSFDTVVVGDLVPSSTTEAKELYLVSDVLGGEGWIFKD